MSVLAWHAPSIDESKAAALAAAMRIRPLTARLLVARGIVEADLAARFLAPRLANLRPPDGVADLPRAVERLTAALGAGEIIGVFGDYDVDGVTTAAILTSALRAFGGTVVPRAASRHAGYGLGVDDVARFAAAGCRVLVTGDCGTSDHEALRAARAGGIDTIVIDHHELPEGETAAYALVNSRRPDDTFPFKGLASCGVAFYLTAALRTRLGVGVRSARAAGPGGAGDDRRHGAADGREPHPGRGGSGAAVAAQATRSGGAGRARRAARAARSPPTTPRFA